MSYVTPTYEKLMNQWIVKTPTDRHSYIEIKWTTVETLS